MSLAQGFPSTFSDTQKTNEVLHNLDNETKKIYNDVNAFMAADGHGHTGNGSDGSLISYEDLTNLPDIIDISGGTLTGALHQPNPVTITSALGILTLLETSNSFIAEGAETITSITGWTVGTVVIRWNTARTLIHNATSLILQNAIDRTTAIGDIGIYEMTSAGARELHYFPVSTLTQLKKDLNATGTAPIYACRAWVNFNGTGTVAIRASGNVSSITDNGVGDYTVNITTDLPDTNYVIVGSTENSNGWGFATKQTNLLTVNSFRIATFNSTSGAANDSSFINVSVFR